MEQKIITFTADQQQLTKTSGITNYASDTISYVKAIFTLGENWEGFDEVRAVFKTPYTCKPAVLDSVGECIVPWEVLMYKGAVRVNLVGSIYTEDEVIDRLTTHSVEALVVDEDVPVCGEASAPLTPSEYEQFVAKVATDANRAEAGATSAEASAGESEASATASAQSATASANSASQAQTYAQNAQNYAVSAETAKGDAIDAKEDAESAKADAENARDQILGMRATANTLAEGSDATASYSNGLLTLGIPRGNTGAKGDKGDKGDTGATPNLSIGTVETLPPTGTSEVTITGTAENPVLNFKLVKGDTGEVTMAQLAQLLPTDTASGDIASFPDGTDVFPAVSVLTTIEPIQSGSGTPSPTNIRPISGHTECETSVAGKNWLNNDSATTTSNGVTFTKNADGTVTANGTASGTAVFRIYTANSPLPNADVILNGCPSGGQITVGYSMIIANSSGTNIGSGTSVDIGNGTTYTSEQLANAYQVQIIIRNGTTVNNLVFKPMIRLASETDATFEPYEGHQYTTSLGRTVYGGTLDVVSGVLTVDRAMVDLGTLTWVKYGNYTDYDRYYSSGIDSTAKINSPSVCSHWNGSTTWGAGNIVVGSGSGKLNIFTPKGAYASASELKTAMNGAQLVYELATPQTYQLTAQEVELLLGQNNLWTDCGSVNVTYKADTYLWVAKQLGQ